MSKLTIEQVQTATELATSAERAAIIDQLCAARGTQYQDFRAFKALNFGI